MTDLSLRIARWWFGFQAKNIVALNVLKLLSVAIVGTYLAESLNSQ